MGAYERLGLLELRARAVYINWAKDGVKSKMEDRFSYLLNNSIFSIFLKEEKDWELMTSFSHKVFLPQKKPGMQKTGQKIRLTETAWDPLQTWILLWRTR